MTERIVEQAAEVGIKHIWIQGGAESTKAVRRAEKLGMNVIAGGPCILVTLGFMNTTRFDRIRGANRIAPRRDPGFPNAATISPVQFRDAP